MISVKRLKGYTVHHAAEASESLPFSTPTALTAAALTGSIPCQPGQDIRCSFAYRNTDAFAPPSLSNAPDDHIEAICPRNRWPRLIYIFGSPR